MKVVACTLLFVDSAHQIAPWMLVCFWSCASQPYATHADVVLNADECYPILPWLKVAL
jgi:hypothetical protein